MTVDQDTLRLTPVAAIPFPIRAVWLAMALMICSAGQAQVIDTSTAPGGPSTYVAIDSWVYPALDRLAADGYVETAFSSLRPWTRNECARLTQEAEDQMDERAAGSDARRLLDALQREFAPELGDSDPARRGGRLNPSISERQ